MAHCARRREEDLTWKRMVREVEDGKSKWGTRLKEDWKELGVNTVRGWCNKVKDRGWLASKMGEGERRRERRRQFEIQRRSGISSSSWAMRAMSCGARVC